VVAVHGATVGQTLQPMRHRDSNGRSSQNEGCQNGRVTGPPVAGVGLQLLSPLQQLARLQPWLRDCLFGLLFAGFLSFGHDRIDPRFLPPVLVFRSVVARRHRQDRSDPLRSLHPCGRHLPLMLAVCCAALLRSAVVGR